MALWDIVLGPIISIINKIIPDKAAAAAAIAQLQQLEAQGALEAEKTQLASITSAQSDVDKVEAANSSMFVAGWRPAIGWVCGAALAFQYVARPLIQWGFSMAHQPVPVLPGIDDNLWQLMTGMLGMGALRSYDKVKGTATTGVK